MSSSSMEHGRRRVNDPLKPKFTSPPARLFCSSTPSAFRIRRQPHPDFYSTIEAIHHVIDLFAPTENENPAKPRPHDNLLAVFGTAVSRQLYYTDRS
jgi:DTW domain-containing protein YfiP